MANSSYSSPQTTQTDQQQSTGEQTTVVASQDQSHTLWAVLMLVLGVVAMLAPFAAGLAVAVTFGILLIVAGAFQLAFALQADSFGRGVGRFLFGGITLAAGVYCVTQSGIAAAALGLLLAVYFVVDGCFILGAAWQSQQHRGWLVAYGVVSLVLGTLLWIGWPLSGIFAIGILLGIRLIFAGVMMLMLGRASVSEIRTGAA